MNVLFVCVGNAGRSCDDTCPVIPGKRYIAWDLPDPKTMPLEQVRPLLAEIELLVDDLIAELDSESAKEGVG